MHGSSDAVRRPGVLGFFRVWLSGYYSPARFAAGLRDRPAPLWGACAVLVRCALLSLLTYLPLQLSGRVPPTPSNLSFIATEQYYGALIWLAPLVLVVQWLLGGAIAHVTLRLAGRPSNIDVILNISAMAGLVVGTFLVAWDWVWILVGGMDQILLGISHLILDIWYIVLTVTGLRRLLEVPVWLGVVLCLLIIATAMPLAIMFMRSPL
jgi:hypothetical protein